jgi:hypothetical protein
MNDLLLFKNIYASIHAKTLNKGLLHREYANQEPIIPKHFLKKVLNSSKIGKRLAEIIDKKVFSR